MIDDFCWSQSIDLFLKNMAKAFFRVRELFLHSLTLIQALDDFCDVQTRLHIEVDKSLVRVIETAGVLSFKQMLKGREEPTILHTDQGSVYASMSYNDLILDTNIIRSMSRAGKPTDNPVNEALNGWIKEELYMDFQLDQCRTREEVKATLRRYIDFYNKQRPCFAIGYDTPDNYCKRFYRGELEKKDTFEKTMKPLRLYFSF